MIDEHAVARGAKIYAEIIGFASNCDAAHVTQPQMETMQICMEMAMQNAGITAEKIDYVSAHGTATDRGDIAESNATANALGKVPISSLKSYFGHTLGACGAIEAWLGLLLVYTYSFTLHLYITISKLENIVIKMIIPTIKNTSYFISFKVNLSNRVIFKK